MLDHVGAGFGTAAAGGGAIEAVLHIGMAFAFLRAAVTDAFGKLAKLFGELAVEAQDLRGGITQSGAFEIQPDAADHTFDVFFDKTCAGALMTEGGTGAAGLDTFLVLLLRHGNYFIFIA
jgi:hypothetical protein